MAESRQHHIVPAFYLREFARDGRLQAFDLETGQWLGMTPGKAARQRDYYALDSPEVSKHFVEDNFIQKIEDAAAPVLKRLSEGDLELSAEGKSDLLAFVALMYVRTEGTRKIGRAHARAMARELIARVAPDEKAFEKSKARMAEDGVDVTGLTYNGLRRAVASDGVNFDLHQNYHVTLMVDVWRTVVATLCERSWSIFRPVTGALSFITSDQPVGLYRKDDAGPENGPYRLDLRDRRTGIVLPLTPRLLLIGDHDFGPELRRIDQTEVARCNMMVAVPWRRFLYCSSRRVRWLDPETSEVRPLDDRLASLARRLGKDEEAVLRPDKRVMSRMFDSAKKRS